MCYRQRLANHISLYHVNTQATPLAGFEFQTWVCPAQLHAQTEPRFFRFLSNNLQWLELLLGLSLGPKQVTIS
jgi:hypothetical protein